MVKKKTFLKIFIITIAIFATGIFVGFSLDTIRTDILSNEMVQANLETESFMISDLYLRGSGNYCDNAWVLISHVARITEELGKNLERFGESRMFKKTSYEYLLRRYYIYELRFWMLVEDYKTRCDKKIMTVLYFFGPNDLESTKQGYVLTAIRNKYKPDFMVFSFNAEFDKEPSIELIKNDYNITSTPVLIINGKKYEGFRDRNELEAVIKSYFEGNSQ